MATGQPPAATHRLFRMAGGDPAAPPAAMPDLAFGLTRTLREYGSRPVPGAMRDRVREDFRRAHDWCQRRLSLAPGADEALIARFVVGRNGAAADMLSASSGGERGVVVFSGSWPVDSPYRLASLILHEAVHQLLFRRQDRDDPVRGGSIGYSPWKDNARPGWLVWHAYWTFTCQAALLAEAIAAESGIAEEDPGLVGFVADIVARTEICGESLALSAIVGDRELRRAARAADRLATACAGIPAALDFPAARARCREQARGDYERWAAILLREGGSGRLNAPSAPAPAHSR